jgi:hypothetical protein
MPQYDGNAINDSGGMEIPKRQRSRRGQLWSFGVDGGNDRDGGEGDCNSHGDEEEGDVVMRLQHSEMMKAPNSHPPPPRLLWDNMTIGIGNTPQQTHKEYRQHILGYDVWRCGGTMI